MASGSLAAWAALITAVLGGAAGVLAAVTRRRSDLETSEDAAARRTMEERAALTAEYRGLLDELRLHGADMERRYEQRLTAVEGQVGQAKAAHEACETNLDEQRKRADALEGRLRTAEARIAELGG